MQHDTLFNEIALAVLCLLMFVWACIIHFWPVILVASLVYIAQIEHRGRRAIALLIVLVISSYVFQWWPPQ